MGDRDHLLGLIADLYAAPGMEKGWISFLDNLCAAVKGSGASFISITSADNRANVAMTVRTDAAALKAYQEHWGAFDPWGRSPILSAVASGAVVLGDELISHPALKQTAFYCDFGRSYDIVRSLVGMIETGAPRISVIAINGTERRGAFSSADAGLLTALMPHLQRALQVHRRLLTSEAACNDVTAVLDLARHAVFLVSASGNVIFMNPSARRLTAARDGLTVERGEISAGRSVGTSRLRALIADAAATSAGHAIGSGGVVALARSRGRPLTAVVSPLSRRSDGLPGGETAAAIVIVADPDRAEVDDETLRALWGLTPSEARLVRLLARGASTADVAGQLNLAHDTVRKRLKGIFEKTNTHRQSELLALMLQTAHSRR
jgi:DNA-binding CsgD family transcriptional regulator/PAS domain-containing protein